MTSELARWRSAIRAAHYAPEADLYPSLVAEADAGPAARRNAQNAAADFVRAARADASRSGLIDKFLQEYGLSTPEGVLLMRLAEALLRTPDVATADALIKDKVEAGDWGAHKGKSPFPLVNVSTRALMATAAWLDDVEGDGKGGQPLRHFARTTKALFDRVGEPVIRASVGQAMKIMGEHFVLGETIEAALRRARSYAERGYTFSFDMLGEAAYTAADADKYFDDYATAIAAIGRQAESAAPEDNPGISVKLSALHPRYEFAQRERVLKDLGGRALDLARAAKRANIGFNIDAEEAYRLDLSLDLIEMLARHDDLSGWSGLGVVVQAYQRRARAVLDWLAALAETSKRRLMVRLVKGAYWDAEIKRAQVGGFPSYPVFTRKVLTDLSYQSCARKLLSRTDVFYPQFATHNALTAALVREVAGETSTYELQRLHGMGEALHDQLIASGARSRIYAPVGGHRELLPYLVRRLLENGANSSFVNQLFDPDLAIDRVVADPIDQAARLAVIANGAIPAPRDLFAGARLSAQGYDLNDPATAERLLTAAARTTRHQAAPLIAGALSAGVAARPVLNPADRSDIVGDVVEATADDVASAIGAAVAAQPAWQALGAEARGAILRAGADRLEAHTDDLIELVVREAGKTLADAVAELREATDFLRYYADQGLDLSAAPLGVVACISPWNFPLAIFLGQVAGALAAGNAVVAKPAEQTPLIAFAAVRLLHEAGVPPAALNLLPGDGPTAGAPLTRDERIAGVVFTGSTEVAQSINRTLAARAGAATLIAETGGINAMIVDSTALLEQAVADCVSSAFQSAGQRCSAARLVLVQDDVADRFSTMLAGAMAELNVGDPRRLTTDVGPVIDAAARDGVARYVDDLTKRVRIIGRASRSDPSADGLFVPPVAFELNDVTEITREIFGPVMHVVRFPAGAISDVIGKINALGYGLTLGLHTRIDDVMHEVAAKARVGNIYVNRNQIGAVVGVQPFGGEGLSGTGPKAGGPHYVAALTKRPSSAGAAEIALTDEEHNTAALIDDAAAAFSQSLTTDRRAALSAALLHAEAPARLVLSSAIELYDRHFAEVEALPGPSGEANTLKLRGKGLALCFGDSETRAFSAALAAGNVLLGAGSVFEALSYAFRRAGGPVLAFALHASRGRRSINAVDDSRVRLVIADPAFGANTDFKKRLAARSGPIIPCLISTDAPWRFAAERTLTVNTTAAGGDVRLLSLSE